MTELAPHIGPASPDPRNAWPARGAAIAGIGMAVPERQVSNTEIAARLGVEESWIARRTGTHTRPWADAGDRLSDLAARAGKEALSRAGIAPDELDLVVVATSTADEMSPNAATVLEWRARS